MESQDISGEKARTLLERVAREPLQWIVADQVLFEYYRLVPNPAVLAKPLSSVEAAERLCFIRAEKVFAQQTLRACAQLREPLKLPPLWFPSCQIWSSIRLTIADCGL